MDSRRSKTRNKQKKKIIIAILVLVLAMVDLFGVLHLIEKRSEEDEQFGDTGGWGDIYEPEDTYLTLNDQDYFSNDNIDVYLLAGTDNTRDDMGPGFNGTMADFIAVLLIDNTTKKYAFYQIDRNTMVEVNVLSDDGDFDNYETEQICTSHWYGRDEEERNLNLTTAVTDMLGGLDIDGYYILGMEDIGKVNHAIGGVVVDFDEDLTRIDPAFTKGAKILLSDEQAEKFLRARTTLDDETNQARMVRHETYMQNAYNMVISQLRENPDYINDLYNELTDLIASDRELDGRDLSMITRQLTQYTNQGIIGFTGKTTEGESLDDGEIHEEFYVNESSILSGLKRVMNLEEDNEEVVDEEDNEAYIDESEDPEDADEEDEAEYDTADGSEDEDDEDTEEDE